MKKAVFFDDGAFFRPLALAAQRPNWAFNLSYLNFCPSFWHFCHFNLFLMLFPRNFASFFCVDNAPL